MCLTVDNFDKKNQNDSEGVTLAKKYGPIQTQQHDFNTGVVMAVGNYRQ